MSEQDVTDGVEWLSKSEYWKRHRLSDSTITRALREGRVPGAVRDGRGHWLIPADAPIVDAPPAGAVVRQTPVTGPLSDPRQTPVSGAGPLSDPRLTPPSDPRLTPVPTTAFVNVRTAARLLGVSEDVVRENAAELDARPWGPRPGGKHGKEKPRSLVVPLATIRRLAGL